MKAKGNDMMFVQVLNWMEILPHEARGGASLNYHEKLVSQIVRTPVTSSI